MILIGVIARNVSRLSATMRLRKERRCDDEPRNMKELIAHPKRHEIQKAEDAEIQRLSSTSIIAQ